VPLCSVDSLTTRRGTARAVWLSLVGRNSNVILTDKRLYSRRSCLLGAAGGVNLPDSPPTDVLQRRLIGVVSFWLSALRACGESVMRLTVRCDTR